MAKLTFKKRKDPDGRSLRNTNQYYRPSLNNQIYNSASGGNCVWYAYGRFLEVWSNASEKQKSSHKWPGFFSANGHSMVSAAASKGFKTGSTPKPGAIVSWSGPSSAGHVAFVEDVQLDKAGNIVSMEVSQSSWTYGNMKNVTMKPPYNSLYGRCLGFAYNPINFAGSNGYVKGTEDSDDTIGIDWAKRIEKLYSSDSYEFIKQEKKEQEEDKYLVQGQTIAAEIKQAFKSINNAKYNVGTKAGTTIADEIVKNITTIARQVVAKVVKTKSTLSIADNLVEAPFIELDISGIKIGSYDGTLDKYPNYISSMVVDKQNGVINQYKINFVYQVRPGEDPNLLDRVLSKNRYTEITIKYGDSNSGTTFLDNNAIVTNVSSQRDYSNLRISYTLEATSEGALVRTYTMNFPARVEKASNIIRELLYTNMETSTILLKAFPGMRNKSLVDSLGLIPTNDCVLEIDAKQNTDLLSYTNYLVNCMSNIKSGAEVVRDSVYAISFNEADNLVPDGAYFKINEIKSDVDPYAVTDRVFEVTVGYPFEEIIYDFSVQSTQSWELLYKNNQTVQEYQYTITNNGDTERYYSPSLNSSSELLGEVGKSWWTSMVKFPIHATLVLRGLLQPIMLMDYVKVNVVFYGQKHILSGTYAIVGQTDSLSSSGYRTSLSLVRVGE